MDKNKTIILLLLAGGVYYWNKNEQLKKRLIQRQQQAFRNKGPAPNKGSQAWRDWIAAIFALYGNVKSLWDEGGPFYDEEQGDIWDVVNEDGILV